MYIGWKQSVRRNPPALSHPTAITFSRIWINEIRFPILLMVMDHSQCAPLFSLARYVPPGTGTVDNVDTDSLTGSVQFFR